jgi:elongation factor G
VHPQGDRQRQAGPGLCGSSFKNKGVQQLLDAVIDYLPYPARTAASPGGPRRQGIAEQEIKDDAPVRALAFKIINDQFGTLTFVRMYSGVVKKGDTLQNVTRGKKERIGRIVECRPTMSRTSRKPVPATSAPSCR